MSGYSGSRHRDHCGYLRTETEGQVKNFLSASYVCGYFLRFLSPLLGLGHDISENRSSNRDEQIFYTCGNNFSAASYDFFILRFFHERREIISNVVYKCAQIKLMCDMILKYFWVKHEIFSDKMIQ